MAASRPTLPQHSLLMPIIHEGHEHRVQAVAFSPDGKSVASGSWKTILILDAHNPISPGKLHNGHSLWISSISYSPLGNVVASGSTDQTIRLWDINTGHQLGQPLWSNTQFMSISFSPDAGLIASGSGGGQFEHGPTVSAVQLWDVRKREVALEPFKGHTRGVCSVEFSPDGTRVVSGSRDRTIRVWDVERGMTIFGPFKGHTSSVRSAAFSPDGSQIVSCSHDKTLRLWDTRSGRIIGKPCEGHTLEVCSVSFSPHGTYVASGSKDNTVRLWDVRAGRQVDRPYEEHTDFVYSVAFSPCGQYIASGSEDRKVIIRSILSRDSEASNYFEAYATAKDEGGLLPNETMHIMDHQMSTQQIFDCLVGAGCNDLSLEMDASQDAARIVAGGGFGDIWMGQLNNGKTVAIKAWRTNALEQTRSKTLKRTARELYYWSRMEHNNIHRLMGVIIFRDEYLGMVSEWMENGDLHKYLRHYPNADRYNLCTDVAAGLEYMHGRSTVHGDLKAANVLVSSNGVARLSDFDFSVMSEASNLIFTATSNNRAGSVRWVAPEMLNGKTPNRTAQSDVYALGMEIFTGQVPYPDLRTDYAIIIAVMQGAIPTRPIRNLKDDQQGNLVWKLLLDCWSRNPTERPSAGLVVKSGVSPEELSSGSDRLPPDELPPEELSTEGLSSSPDELPPEGLTPDKLSSGNLKLPSEEFLPEEPPAQGALPGKLPSVELP
ncbi:unnamed protein product [Rhizoctonia solani]|uniref:Protein kinase domain-containing protein n=1 Tax=Rhizoctonia solani TaxID=456999 RepID=A0A8H3E3W0_9AGAM|nr:unnamed protein product [Rhizoctonia solani]